MLAFCAALVNNSSSYVTCYIYYLRERRNELRIFLANRASGVRPAVSIRTVGDDCFRFAEKLDDITLKDHWQSMRFGPDGATGSFRAFSREESNEVGEGVTCDCGGGAWERKMEIVGTRRHRVLVSCGDKPYNIK